MRQPLTNTTSNRTYLEQKVAATRGCLKTVTCHGDQWSEVKFAVPVIGRGRQHEWTCDIPYPMLGWSSLEWWGQSIPSGHLPTAFSVHPVVSFLALGLAWNLWQSKHLSFVHVTGLPRLLRVLYREFSLSVGSTACQKPWCFLSIPCLESTPRHRMWQNGQIKAWISRTFNGLLIARLL